MNPAAPSWNPLSRWPWLWVVAAFALLLGAWTAFFIIAAKYPTQDVRMESVPAATSNH